MTDAVTRAWAELLPYAEDVREWLGEGGAFACWQRGVRDVHDPATWPVVAAVLADLLGHPSELMEGTPLA